MNSQPVENNENHQFKLLMAKIEHQKRIISRYMKPEEWENLQQGDRVLIDNSDSLHDGQHGTFLAHEWATAGYVRLVVMFPDGKKCFYLPTQVVKIHDSSLQPQPISQPVSQPSSPPIPESKNSPEIEEEANNLIESKLAQVAKMPVSTRKKVLMGSLPPELVKTAIDRGIRDGIFPA